MTPGFPEKNYSDSVLYQVLEQRVAGRRLLMPALMPPLLQHFLALIFGGGGAGFICK